MINTDVYSFRNHRATFEWEQLEIALQKALAWLSNIDDTTEVVNDHIYFGPHKWIVCLLGSRIYTMRNFIDQNESMVKYSANLSISIMTLSEDPLEEEDVNEYRELCEKTKEGLFVNSVSSRKAYRIA